jgi:predicted nuclease of restriction endonuclease-like (RecB) superfamily
MQGNISTFQDVRSRFFVAMSASPLDAPYQEFLQTLKQRIQTAQVRAALAVNSELIQLYWHIGKEILLRQQSQGWGAKVVTQLSQDLRQAFPEMKGFSRTNLLYMRAFAEAYPDEAMVQQVVGQIPWGHNVRLLDAVKEQEERLWYARQAIAQGWSRNVLMHHIDRQLYQRQGSAITNFETALPKAQSDLAQQLLKDPYTFDFLTLESDRQERELERALTDHIRDFLLELGVGFAFIGSQYPIEVGSKEYRLDLLFYHVQLYCYVVIDLKMGEFEPEFSGKMNFYVSAVDQHLRSPRDAPTIGIILCKSKEKTIVEYALQGLNKPIGVSTYQLSDALPEDLHGTLPTADQLRQELNQAIAEEHDRP